MPSAYKNQGVFDLYLHLKLSDKLIKISRMSDAKLILGLKTIRVGQGKVLNLVCL